jgi:hypothetical protein
VTDDVRAALEDAVPLRPERRPDWDDVLTRARPAPSGRRLLLAAWAAAAIGAAAVSPLGTAVAGLGRDAFDGLSAWLTGAPGEPAPPAELAGFVERNDASYASFPAGTKLRLVGRERAGGKTFSLLGFRNGDSLCLRLVRADLAGGRGENQCVTLRELKASSAPVLVAADAYFRFGDPELNAQGVFGFADDTVRAIEVRRSLAGWTRVVVRNNVFVTLRARPTGTVKNHPPRDPVVEVRAIRRDGTRARVPYVAGDTLGGRFVKKLHGPSYLRPERTRPEDLPGPAAVERAFAGGTIGWLERHERRGLPLRSNPREEARRRRFLGPTIFGRVVRPDPASPVRVAISLVRRGPRPFGPPATPGVMLCETLISPLQRSGSGVGCIPTQDRKRFAPGRPITVSWMGPSQITELHGLAADAVAAIDVFLASGRRIPAALHDNAWFVQAPTAQFPAKLVAYDRDQRALYVDVLGGASRPFPCPQAAFTRPVSALPPPRPYERLDLGALTVNGSRVFGRSVGEVTAALGRPDRVAHFSSTNGIREPTLFYGGTLPGSAALTVRFGMREAKLIAVALSYGGASLVDARLGHVLRLQPADLERRIARTYGARFHLGTPYGTDLSSGCTAVFTNRQKTIDLSIVLDPRHPSRPQLVVSHHY